MGTHWQNEKIHYSLKDAKITIALLHHPPNWLVEQEDNDTWRVLTRDFRFILHGHEHQDWVTTNADGRTRIAAGACYERSDKNAGYNFVRLYLNSGKGEVWLREYDAKGGGWVSARVYGKTDDRGVWPLNHLNWLEAELSTATMAPPEELAGDGSSEPYYSPPSAVSSTGIWDMLVSTPGKGVELPEFSLPRSVHSFSGDIDEHGLITALLGFFSHKTPVGPESPRQDIVMQPIESHLDHEIPLVKKSPVLQELRTERQIVDHFLPLPKFVNAMDSWLAEDRDLLIL